MGIIPFGDGRKGGFGSVVTSTDTAVDVAQMLRSQAAFLAAGAVIGILGVILPHPEDFLVPELLALNMVSIILASLTWVFSDRISLRSARIAPAIGTIAITFAVVFSRDSTSAYTLLYIFPAIYAFYFLQSRDALWHILFAVFNYAVAIAVLGAMATVTPASSGRIVHHFVITVGNMALVGAMLVYLRRRVERLMGNIIASARTDLLTGALNSRGLAEIVTSELERARMGGHRVAMLTVELGGLREMGSKSGHQAVDTLIKQAAELLDDSTRGIDAVARTGSSEYCVVLPETDESTAFLLAEQILSRFRRVFREGGLPLKTSIGIAAFPKHAAGVEGLVQASADAAEAAQALGSDRAVVYSAELRDVISEDPARGLAEGRTHLSTVLSLAEVLDLRDARTATHSLAVSRYCELIARELGLSEQRIQRLRLAGMVHDIGKVGIPESILEKPGPLSPSEWDEVRRHPEMAARILGARELTDIREWILTRHEQPDGHGYPRGMSGDAIPLEARIIAVAEAYDAMTNERPYRPARTREEAIAELGRYAGTQFDGRVVDTLVKVLSRVGEQDPAEV